MTKIEIISGFLGAGKTTLIRKFLEEKDPNETIAIIENEFGEVGIDGSVLQQSGVSVREINAGCICCSLVGNFDAALRELLKKYHPDRIVIEPSGVGKLSDIYIACEEIGKNYNAVVSFCATVVDAKKYPLYKRNFAEFYINQIESTKLVLLSRTDLIPIEKQKEVAKDIMRINPDVHLISTPWNQLSAEDIRQSAHQSLQDFATETIDAVLPSKDIRLVQQTPEHTHHLNHESCSGTPGEHGRLASDVFSFWGVETPVSFDENNLRQILLSLSDPECGNVLRAKGIVRLQDEDADHSEKWCVFDFVQEEIDIRPASPAVIGKLCVIGSGLNPRILEARFEI